MSERRPIRVLIVEDEPLGCARLLQLLGEHDDVAVVGVAETGDAAVDAIRSEHPDLVFLDVQIPRLSGIEVIRAVGADRVPAIVFVTAGEQYALEAFEFAAVDYLLKPYSDERFERALGRARRLISLAGLENLRQRLSAILDAEAPAVSTPTKPKYLERITVQMRGRIRIVSVKDIDYIAASGVYARLVAGADSFLIRETLQSLEEQLNPDHFFRIHRSEIVRLDRVEALLRARGGDYRVQLKGGVTLPVSRGRREELELRLKGAE